MGEFGKLKRHFNIRNWVKAFGFAFSYRSLFVKKIQYATFVKNEFDAISACFALRSLQLLELDALSPIVLMPEQLLNDLEEKYPTLGYKNLVRNLGGNLKIGFKSGFNPKNAVRAGFTNLAQKIGEDAMLYFAPSVIFHNDMRKVLCGDNLMISRSPDALWPLEELYGPTLEDIWGALCDFSQVNLSDWILEEQPRNYWRRYPLVSSFLIFAPRPKEFAENFDRVWLEMADKPLHEIEGQGLDIEPAVLAIVAMQAGAKPQPIDWDHEVVAFTSFEQLMLRMQPRFFEIFCEKYLDFADIRKRLKKIPIYKTLFYHAKMRKIRSDFGAIEANFGMKRMDELIERRKLKKTFAKIAREFDQKNQSSS